jgi:TPR repeat protein
MKKIACTLMLVLFVSSTLAQTVFRPDVTPQQRAQYSAWIEAAQNNPKTGTGGSTRARELLAYSFRNGLNGLKPNCQEAYFWFDRAASASGDTDGSVMADYYAGLGNAEGCPIGHNRNATLARQIWVRLLYDPKATPDLRKLIEQSLDILTKEGNPQDPRNYTQYGESDAQTLSDHYRDLAIGFAFAGVIAMGIANSPPTEYTCDDRPPQGCNFKPK